jgi:hypothetical protein
MDQFQVLGCVRCQEKVLHHMFTRLDSATQPWNMQGCAYVHSTYGNAEYGVNPDSNPSE